MNMLMVHARLVGIFAFHAIIAIAQPALMASLLSIIPVFTVTKDAYAMKLAIAFPV
jgi:hypothetical protein